MDCMYLTFCVSKFETSRLVTVIQSMNIFLISVTFEVTKMSERVIVSADLQPENI